jgi:hypothetical protein
LNLKQQENLEVLGAMIGCFCPLCIRKGWRKLLNNIFILVIAISAGLLVTGIVALCVKQPHHVWFSFLFFGGLGTILFSGLFPVMRKIFTNREMMKMQAEDL